jgi:hypothetical protein
LYAALDRKSVLASVAIQLCSTWIVSAQEPTHPVPRFESYPAGPMFTGAPAKVDFKSDREGLRFKTRLSEGIKQGSNFAGEYTIVRWGCGSPCGAGAILHTPTGRICAWFESCGGEEFKPDSRLLIINPGDNLFPELRGCNTAYYLWDGKKLSKLLPKSSKRL